MVPQEIEESYRFDCRRCGADWTRSYTVRSAVTRDGDAEILYFRNRVPVSAPQTGARCPRCGGLRVHVTLAHRTV